MHSIISISPFCIQVISGATWRISFITSFLKKEGRVFEFYRWSYQNESNLSKDLFFWSKNKFIHFFDFRVVWRIFKTPNATIYCHHIWSSAYGIFFSFLLGRKYIFDNHNVEFDRMRSSRRYILSLFIYVFEFLSIYFSDTTIVSSFEDKMRLIQLYPFTKRIEVHENKYVSNLISSWVMRHAFFYTLWIDPGKKILLFFGSSWYFPNEEALLFIQTEIVPQLNDSYHVVIAWSISENFISTPQITYLWFIDDLDTLIIHSDLVIAPIFSGWGVKIKIIQSIALGKYIVTTKEGMRWIRNYNPNLIQVRERSDFLTGIFELIKY